MRHRFAPLGLSHQRCDDFSDFVNADDSFQQGLKIISVMVCDAQGSQVGVELQTGYTTY